MIGDVIPIERPVMLVGLVVVLGIIIAGIVCATVLMIEAIVVEAIDDANQPAIVDGRDKEAKGDNAMKQATNAGELHLLTLDCPNTMNIVAPAFDHAYREALVHRGTAILHPDGSWSEDYGDINPTEWETDGSKRVEVLIVQ